MSFDERMARLREILTEDASETTWETLWQHLSSWPQEEEAESAVHYAEQHIQEHWDLALCKLENPPETVHPAHQLISSVTLDDTDLEKEHLWDALEQYQNLRILDVKIDINMAGRLLPLHRLRGLKELAMSYQVLNDYQDDLVTLPKGITKLSLFALERNCAHLFEFIAQQIEDLQELSIEDWEGFESSDDNFSVLAQYPNLRKLSLAVGSMDLDHLAPLTQLTELSITEGNYLSGDLCDINGLSSLTQLTKLTLYCSDPMQFEVLGQLDQLAELTLYGVSNNDLNESLSKMHNLRKLTLYGANLYGGEDQFTEFFGKAPQLQELSIYGTEFYPLKWNVRLLGKLTKLVVEEGEDINGIDELEIYGLDQLVNLKELALIWNHVAEREDDIAALTKLEKLTLHSCYFLKNLDFLKNLSKLKELSLSDCQELEHLDGLADLPRLEKLSFVECNFPSESQTPKRDIMHHREEVQKYQEQLQNARSD